jgi:hypothetical protein
MHSTCYIWSIGWLDKWLIWGRKWLHEELSLWSVLKQSTWITEKEIDYIKMDLRRIGCEAGMSIEQARQCVQTRAFIFVGF